MKQVLFLEPVGGIAGDMFLAAALDLGVKLEDVEKMLRTLDLPGWQFKVTRQERHSITGTHVDVVVDEAVAGHQHRSWKDIDALIKKSGLPEQAKARALDVFLRIGTVEAQIHGVSLEEIHFHEVGAVDSIVDICAAAVVLELLGNPTVISTPPPLGSGTVRIAHGVVPVPVPATLALLKDVPVKFEGIGELTTPTGAALLRAFATIGTPPQMTVSKVGYGLGTKDFKDRANLLRMSVGQPLQQQTSLVTLECNLDDCSPQVIGAVTEQLLEAGALDVWVVAAQMKKNRPGQLLSILCETTLRETLVDLVFRETTTLGIREVPVARHVLERRFETVQTQWGPVKVKIGFRGATVFNAVPEFEDCRALSREFKVPLKQVQQAALSAWARSA